MDQDLNNKTNLKEKVILFLKENKLKVFISIFFGIFAIIFLVFLKINNEKKNNQIAEQFIQAGIYFSSNNLEKSKDLYENIILSKNKFYSILAFNTILEKKIITDEKKILEYFKIIESLDISKDQTDLIVFKKSLYLMNNDKTEEANELLETLIGKIQN